MIYILERNQVPQGSQSQIEDVLRGESSNVRAVFDSHKIRVKSFLPSRDASRFPGLEDVTIPPSILERMCFDLGEVGYNLAGPFESRMRASEYWQTGK